VLYASCFWFLPVVVSKCGCHSTACLVHALVNPTMQVSDENNTRRHSLCCAVIDKINMHSVIHGFRALSGADPALSLSLTSPTAKRDTHGSETLLHEELQISFYNERIVLRFTELVL
jgi:hypothetical protein